MNTMRRNLVMAGLMVATSAGTAAIAPKRLGTTAEQAIDLHALIPRQFDGWRLDPRLQPIAPPPDVQAEIDKVYSATMARTYVNDRGEIMMLSIAYGAEQTDSLRVHLPEICYTNQGFKVLSALSAAISLKLGELPIKRVVATRPGRNEPITYWILIGDQPVLGHYRMKLAQLQYGLSGRLPDGMLVRISSISRDAEGAFVKQEAFIQSMLASLQGEGRTRLLGRLSG